MQGSIDSSKPSPFFLQTVSNKFFLKSSSTLSANIMIAVACLMGDFLCCLSRKMCFFFPLSDFEFSLAELTIDRYSSLSKYFVLYTAKIFSVPFE